jgi:DNA-binding transcriptional regulator YbjK
VNNAEPARARRLDPDRRDRIIDAALAVVVAEGVAGISHRKVAAAADVPLGSMTYHFAGMEELVHEAFTRFARSISDRIDRRMAATRTRAEALDALIAHIEQDLLGDQRDLVLTHELYTLAAHDARYRTLTTDWMSRSRAALERHFDMTTARILDAVVEGLTIHRALDLGPVPPGLARESVRRITASA